MVNIFSILWLAFLFSEVFFDKQKCLILIIQSIPCLFFLLNAFIIINFPVLEISVYAESMRILSLVFSRRIMYF